MNIRIVLEQRQKGNGLYPLKLAFTHKRTTVRIGLDIELSANQWNGREVVNHPQKATLNMFVQNRLSLATECLIKLKLSGAIENYSPKRLSEVVRAEVFGVEKQPDTFVRFFMDVMEQRKGNTYRTYCTVLHSLQLYCRRLDKLTFEEITPNFIRGYIGSLNVKENTKHAYLQKLSVVCNAAVDEDIIVKNPCRKVRVKTTPTRKRSLSVQNLRKLFEATPQTENEEFTLDLAKLMFLLIGINPRDLAAATEIRDGRLDYIRAKTKKQYSIKVYPQAMQIIKKYAGSDHLVPILEKYTSVSSFLNCFDNRLKRIARREGITPNDISAYWFRHSWATIAAELDIPKETIAAGLGHEIGNPITSIYIDFNIKKVDEANKKVIEYVFGAPTIDAR